jgi:hypothetical protein
MVAGVSPLISEIGFPGGNQLPLSQPDDERAPVTEAAAGPAVMRRDVRTMKKQNCWEFKQCGRGPAGKKDCPTAQETALNGIHGGVHAGRACWVSAGTVGTTAASGTFAIVLRDCLRCDFFRLVKTEEGGSEAGFSATRLGMLKILQDKKPSPAIPPSAGSGHIDIHLRDEFAQEVNKITSEKNNGQHDLQEEFAKEVERLTSRPGKSGK